MKPLKAKLSELPNTPGVYLFKDAQGTIIYIGKAKSLKKRVSSYFNRALDTKTQIMVAKIADLEYRLCRTESLALLLEAALIHQYIPKYNISLRDDKSFPLIKITNEDFPRVCVTRKKENDGARYIGPFTSAQLLREALLILRRYFPYRSCNVMPDKACIYYQIGLSPAPCIGKITQEEYAKTIKKIILFLEGKTDVLVKELTKEMLNKAKDHEFEAAAQIRDKIAALSSISANRIGFDSHIEEEGLQRLLRLKRLPERIEAFDISNISGKEACGSMVSFIKGVPDKDNYRRFRIKRVRGIDDYGMIREVVSRRYQRVVREGIQKPDLILIDGGMAHLSVAKQELDALGLSIPMISIAKGQEHVYVTTRKRPISFLSDTPALNLIRRIRDEAHRFAVAYHHILRRKKVIGT
ncbi:MAG: excinuclease ABC subunit UvrC [Candidatus Omnitrophica bacterium]|nr:excinuclease ABC subunit UvrC [Candidatus Omnitrophota bacterium]